MAVSWEVTSINIRKSLATTIRLGEYVSIPINECGSLYYG